MTLRGKLFAGLSPLLVALLVTVLVGSLTSAGDPSGRHGSGLLVVVGLMASLLGLASSATWISRLLRPLGVLSAASRRIGQGDLAARAVVHGNDELALLAHDFNEMTERLQRYQKSSLGQLLQVQQNLQATIDSIPDPILVIALDGALVQANDAARTTLPIGPDASGTSWSAALAPGLRDGVERGRQHVLAGKGRFVPQGLQDAVTIDSADGPKQLMARAEPVYDEDRSITATTVILQDVTRLVRLDELRSNLVATVAHELRTPLTSIRMAIHMCAEAVVGPLTPKQADLLFTARDECERLQAIVDELLDASRVDAGQAVRDRTIVAAEALVNDAIEAMRGTAEPAEVRLCAQVLPGVGHVSVDTDQMKILFSNLITNAIHHSPSGATVTVGARQAIGAIEFDVCDQGPGISPEHHRAVFEPHFQAPGGRPGAAGLGLAIAKRIVDEHGGEIGVESTPGTGARFRFRLPAIEASPRNG